MRKSLNKVIPSDSQKKRMLHNINNKKSGGFQLVKLAILSVITLMFVYSVPLSNDVPILINSRSNYIYYDKTCYNFAIGEFEVGKKIGNTKLDSITYDVYENKLDEKTILLFNEYYILYVECEDYK